MIRGLVPFEMNFLFNNLSFRVGVGAGSYVAVRVLYGQVDQDIYMEQSEGYTQHKNKVCKLNKALYGLKQGARMWHLEITATLSHIGFKNLINDSGIFINADRGLILAIWVDDIIGPARSRADHKC